VRYDILVRINEYPDAVILAFLEDGDDVVDVGVIVDPTALSERKRGGRVRLIFGRRLLTGRRVRLLPM